VKRAAVVALLGAQIAHADPPKPEPEATPDPAAERAAEANLESTARRKGLTFMIAAGGALTIGVGFDQTVERGGSVSLRLGAVATPKLVATIELTNMTLLHKVKASEMSDTFKNFDNNLFVGMQYYVHPAAWVRGSIGLAGYTGEQVERKDGTIGDLSRVGVGGAVGAGFEILRVAHGIAAGLEIIEIGAFNRDGFLSSTAVMFDLSFD
jgi:hypothetical protein